MKRSILCAAVLSLVACQAPPPPKKESAPIVASPPKERPDAPIAEPQAVSAIDLRTLPDTEAKTALSLDQWKLVSDPSQKDTLYQIAFGNGTYVAIGDNQTILISTNSIVWERQVIENLDGAQQIAFGAGRFILRSKKATYQSSDGQTWSLVEKAPGKGSHLQFVNNQFTQVSDNTFYTSADGLAWVEHPAQLREGLSTFGAGVHVLVDFYKDKEGATEQLFSYTSREGKTWEKTVSDAGSSLVTGLLYAKGLFLLLQSDGLLLTSVEGKAWSKGERLSDKGIFGNLIECRDRFLVSTNSAEGGALAFSSPDAKAWTKHSFGFTKGINDLVCGEGVVVGVGVDGVIFIAKL
jgi:hypothetical protein